LNERTLLERMRREEADGGRQAGEDLEALASSILTHLQHMLNSRQGSSESVPDYGMPDLTGAARAFPLAMEALEDAIRLSIEKYEPRLAEVVVRHVGSVEGEFKLSFEIRARLATSSAEAAVWYRSKIDLDGRIEVAG